MSRRMYLSGDYCPKCGTRLKLSRMSFRHFCEECNEYIDLEKENTMDKIMSFMRVRCD